MIGKPLESPPPERDRHDRSKIELARRTVGLLETYDPAERARQRVERAQAAIDHMEGGPGSNEEDVAPPPVHRHWHLAVAAVVRNMRSQRGEQPTP